MDSRLNWYKEEVD